jgi:hypothetical protein
VDISLYKSLIGSLLYMMATKIRYYVCYKLVVSYYT